MDIHDSEKGRFERLIFFITVATALWIGSLNLLYTFSKNINVEYTFDAKFLVVTLFFTSFFTFVYFLITMRALFYHTGFSGSDVDKALLLKKRDESYADVESRWKVLLTTLVLFVLLITIQSTITSGVQGLTDIPALFVLILMALVLLFIIGIVNYGILFHKYMIQPVLKHGHGIRTDASEAGKSLSSAAVSSISKYWSGKVMLLMLGLFVFYSIIVISFTSGVEIKPDKPMYYPGETVYFEVRPYGPIPPDIINVTYSNRNYQIYDGRQQLFANNPRYLNIPGSLLTTDSYNSFIVVTYRYDIWWIPLRNVKLAPVRVFSNANMSSTQGPYLSAEILPTVDQTDLVQIGNSDIALNLTDNLSQEPAPLPIVEEVQ